MSITSLIRSHVQARSVAITGLFED